MTSEKAFQYLKMMVALDNSQLAKDTLEFFESMQQTNEKLKSKNDTLIYYLHNYKQVIKEKEDTIERLIIEKEDSSF